MEEMPRSRHDRTWVGFTGAVAGAAVLSPFLAASAVARELLRPDPSDTDINRQLTRLANDSFGLHAEAQRIAATISFPTAQEFLQLIFEGCIGRLLAENRLFPPRSMFDAFADVVLALYDLLNSLFLPKTPPTSFFTLSMVPVGATPRDTTLRNFPTHNLSCASPLLLSCAAFMISYAPYHPQRSFHGMNSQRNRMAIYRQLLSQFPLQTLVDIPAPLS